MIILDRWLISERKMKEFDVKETVSFFLGCKFQRCGAGAFRMSVN